MASIQYVVNAVDNASGTFQRIAVSTDSLKKNLDELSRKVATPSIDVNDKAAQLKVADMAVRLNRLTDKVYDAKVEVDTAKAAREILKIDAMLTALGKKDEKVSVEVAKRGGILGKIGGALGGLGHFRTQGGDLLSGLLSGGGSAAGGAQAAAGSAGGGIPGGLGIGALAGAGALLGPALLPYALGLGAGGAGAYLAGGSTIKKDFAETMTALKQQVAPLRPLFNSVFESLPNLIKQIGPGLRNVFAESVPFLKSFVGFLGQAAKILLPSFAEVLRKMIPFLPMINTGLLQIVKGFAMFLNALGPNGMKAAATIFVAAAVTIRTLLDVLGHLMDWLSAKIVQRVNDWRKTFDDFRHRTAVIFDGIRHDIAHYWDMIWNNTIGRLQNGLADWKRLTDGWWNDIAHWYDIARHDIASWWDTIWNNTVGRVQRGIADVVNFFKGLPGKVVNALLGLGTKLWNLGKTWLTDLWNGIKSIWHDVLHFFSSIPGDILHALGIHSPPDWAINAGKHIMQGLHLGMQGTLHTVLGVTGTLGGMLEKGLGGLLGGGEPLAATGRFGGGAGVNRWAGVVLSVLRLLGLPPGYLGPWLTQMQTESGGNPTAINLSDINAQQGDPSRGLLQVIGTTFDAYAGQFRDLGIYNPLANIYAAINYALHRYGRTGMLSVIGHGHGYALGTSSAARGWAWVGERGPELVNFRGGESVTPLGRRAGPLVHVDTMIVQDATDVPRVASELSFRIVTSGFG